MNIQNVTPVSKSVFLAVFEAAKRTSDRINESTSPVAEVAANTTERDGFYLDPDGRCGFIVREGGELIALFSMLRRTGDQLVQQAKGRGANHLDCFDGYLVGFYERNGFTVTRREPNWTPGGPDVVYMHTPEYFGG